MKPRKMIRYIHLVLGLSSGLIVFIVAITGCLYAFKEEIQGLNQSYRYVEEQAGDFLLPSEVQPIAEKIFPGRPVHSVGYGARNEAAEIVYYEIEPEFYSGAYINPYTGEVLKVIDFTKGFFPFVLDGHFYLWLPPQIGQPVVATATLIFVVLLITGMILWWPKKANVKQRFSIKWSARWRRKNFDLHSVLGFYTSWVVIVLALTGLVWGFQWFAKTVYYTAGGEKELLYQEPLSDTTRMATASDSENNLDLLWKKMKTKYPEAPLIEVHYPHSESASLYINIKHDEMTYWRSDYLFFDQYTLQEVEPDHIYGKFENASVADKLMRMNYDIHIGAIFGLAGKVLAFFASLLTASLPVTGFMIWWGRKNKKKRKVPRVSQAKQPFQHA